MHTRKDEQIWFDAATSTNSDGYNILDLLLLGERNLDERKKVKTTVQYLFKETDMFYLLKLLRNKPRRSEGDTNDSNVIDSPFRRLLKLYPETLPDLMDRCIVKCTGTTNYYFEILDDTYFLHTWPPKEEYYCKWLYQCTWDHIGEAEKEGREAYSDQLLLIKSNHPVMLMLKHKRDEKDPQKKKIYKQLLAHKLVTALRRHKWFHIGRKFHILSLILYILFLSILTTFVVEINSLNIGFPLYIFNCVHYNICMQEQLSDLQQHDRLL
ncbi:transient receptor potential cation channel subfamily A member 1 homolog isoform X2 [Ruditapes philippinarum]|uniref:transient receptor potential cation channel subfamily A member 1 homolog isoform X2 n=1 Tax=Ruditapes philippinarum TaxID=129788 RepID=UPI00295B9049|nr:transient receptor potential cation channel subfamily A member 1 homolog isoform X2 [Ruditapes philippinarum]